MVQFHSRRPISSCEKPVSKYTNFFVDVSRMQVYKSYSSFEILMGRSDDGYRLRNERMWFNSTLGDLIAGKCNGCTLKQRRQLLPITLFFDFVNAKAVGEISEAIVAAHLIKLGRRVAIPFGNNQRYDLIVDDGKSLFRVQVKTGKLKRGCVVFYTCSSNGFTFEKRNYRGQIDVFAVYCPQNGEIYWVPVDAVGGAGAYLRIEPPASKQRCKIRWAKDFRI